VACFAAKQSLCANAVVSGLGYQFCSRSLASTASLLGHTRRTVRRWHRRALVLVEHLAQASSPLSGGDFRRLLLSTVADASRPGGPPAYSAEQQCAIIALAVRKPDEFDLPIQEWSNRELGLVAEREGSVSGMSPRTVGRILDEADLKPHRIKYWENPTIEDEEAFRAEVADICALYRDAPRRAIGCALPTPPSTVHGSTRSRSSSGSLPARRCVMPASRPSTNCGSASCVSWTTSTRRWLGHSPGHTLGSSSRPERHPLHRRHPPGPRYRSFLLARKRCAVGCVDPVLEATRPSGYQLLAPSRPGAPRTYFSTHANHRNN